MSLTIIDGGANTPLAEAIAGTLAAPLTRRIIGRFPDGEAQIQLIDPVADDDVVIIQPTGLPPDAHLIELLLLADAARRGGAAHVTAVIPYFGYARQDHDGGRPIAATLAARLIESAGVEAVIALDLHSRLVESSLRIPVRNVSAVQLLAERLRPLLPDDAVIVAPDLGAVKLAEHYAGTLELPVAFVRKERVTGAAVEAHGITGDVRGRTPVIVDDMISTGGTIVAAARACIGAGARADVFVSATHGLLVGDASARLQELPLRALFVTDSIVAPQAVPQCLERVTVAGLLAREIADVRYGRSLPGGRAPSRTEEESYVSRQS
jgi:ribose-phosphate pyrophosphokinase